MSRAQYELVQPADSPQPHANRELPSPGHAGPLKPAQLRQAVPAKLRFAEKANDPITQALSPSPHIISVNTSERKMHSF